MQLDRIIKGGKIATEAGLVRTDVGIAGEKIAALGCDLHKLAPDATIIDARGHYVLPGVIDVHVHLKLPQGKVISSDDFVTGTRAAARGGVTTVIDFATPYARKDGNGYESLSEAVDNWHVKAEGNALIDYAYHICITHWEEHKTQVREMIRRGYPTFKEFMIYKQHGWQSDDKDIFGTLEAMAAEGGLLLMHAESAGALDELTERYHTRPMMKKYGIRLHPMTRPNYTEWEAVQRAITWSEVTGGPLYIVHMSAGESADLVRAAQARGVKVLAETCAQYLVLDDSVFRRKNGHLFATCPQLKKPQDRERLWQGLTGGELSVVSTDTCSFTRKQKDLWRGDWTKIPMGLPGLETLLPLVYTYGVLGGRLSMEQMVEKLCANPSRIMGLWPRKGAVQVGFDADLAIIHPRKTLRVDPRTMETNTDWSPYLGQQLAGFARTTLSRGEVIVDDYKVVGKQGRGRWLERQSPML